MRSCLPIVENVGQAKQPPDQPRLGVLSRAPEKGVVVEIEVDNVSEAVHRDAGNVVAHITVPTDVTFSGRLVYVAAVAV